MSEQEEPQVSLRDPRLWLGSTVHAGVYLGIIFGWMGLTSLVLRIDLFTILSNDASLRIWALGLVAGLVAIPAFKLGEKLKSRLG